ncbi:serine/threonine protein kinase, partial [Streptomyces sp. NPDC000151]
AAGERRAGSARHRVRKRRVRLGLAAAGLVAVAGIGTWLASGDDTPDDARPGTEQTAPDVP